MTREQINELYKALSKDVCKEFIEDKMSTVNMPEEEKYTLTCRIAHKVSKSVEDVISSCVKNIEKEEEVFANKYNLINDIIFNNQHHEVCKYFSVDDKECVMFIHNTNVDDAYTSYIKRNTVYTITPKISLVKLRKELLDIGDINTIKCGIISDMTASESVNAICLDMPRPVIAGILIPGRLRVSEITTSMMLKYLDFGKLFRYLPKFPMTLYDDFGIRHTFNTLKDLTQEIESTKNKWEEYKVAIDSGLTFDKAISILNLNTKSGMTEIQSLDDLLYGTPKVTFNRSVENKKAGTFDFIDVEMLLVGIDKKIIVDILKREKKELIDRALRCVEEAQIKRKFSIPVNYLKVDNIVLTNQKILLIKFSVKMTQSDREEYERLDSIQRKTI